MGNRRRRGKGHTFGIENTSARTALKGNGETLKKGKRPNIKKRKAPEFKFLNNEYKKSGCLTKVKGIIKQITKKQNLKTTK